MAYTVLLVDDNTELLDLLALALEKLGGYTTARAADGLAGLEMAVASAPDCMVIDILMPQLDGYQLVRTLRGDPDTADIPLIVLTALAQDKDRFASLASGADYYLTKPVSIPDLVAAIQRAIALNVAERAQRFQHLATDEESEA
jgi:two-component system, OmpR family, alkaline phosphatase synthesis response regulator PhoP